MKPKTRFHPDAIRSGTPIIIERDDGDIVISGADMLLASINAGLPNTAAYYITDTNGMTPEEIIKGFRADGFDRADNFSFIWKQR